MEKSTVYFTDMRCPVGTSLLGKLERLITRAGIDNINFEGRYTAIKIHFGEEGNLAFLRPNFAKVVADHVRAAGGKPFLTDCNTLYIGRRRDALEHLAIAAENGYTPLSTGCQILIADGLKGNDDVEVPVEGGVYCKTARIGQAIHDADVFISLSHFKGHEQTGFGGAIKNIGMGCGSRAGKMQMHNDGKPDVDPKACKACHICAGFCAQDAIQYREGGIAYIDHERCVGCGRCIAVCSFDAIENGNDDESRVSLKMAEYAKAAINGRPNFHITVVNQVSPYCDCHGENDAAIVPDIGMFASFDPVALDHACIDAVNAAPAIATSAAGDHAGPGDHLTAIHPTTNWRHQLEHAESIGLGNQSYELVIIK